MGPHPVPTPRAFSLPRDVTTDVNTKLGGFAFGLGLLLGADVDLALADLDVVSRDFMFCRAGDHASGAHVELGAVPRALHRAIDQRAVRERAAAMIAMVADGEDAFRTLGDGDAIFVIADGCQHH